MLDLLQKSFFHSCSDLLSVALVGRAHILLAAALKPHCRRAGFLQ
jgi:hypothetical protein